MIYIASAGVFQGTIIMLLKRRIPFLQNYLCSHLQNCFINADGVPLNELWRQRVSNHQGDGGLIVGRRKLVPLREPL